MADTGHRVPVQHAHSSSHVTLGHFGSATYDDATKEWSFLRGDRLQHEYHDSESTNSHPFRLVNGPVKVIPTVDTPNVLPDDSNKLSTNSFLKFMPDAGCISDYLERATVPAHERSEGGAKTLSLIAFGSALVLGSNDLQSGLQTTPVAAFVSSTDSDRLTLFLLDIEPFSLRNGASPQVHVPSISFNESISWHAQNGPILEVCFSDKSSQQVATWLAVRQSTTISIFQPLFHRVMTSITNHSALDHNFVVEIPASRTGGLELSCAIFHPKNPHLIAVVDVGGTWSMWMIKGKRSKSAHILYQAELMSQGSFVSEPGNIKQFDGWHKIVWISQHADETDRLLVVNREAAGLFDLNGNFKSAASIRVGSKQAGWVSDLVLTKNYNEFFVVTATHGFYMVVEVDGAPKSKSRIAEIIRVMLSWNHSRGRCDQSLRLHRMEFLDVTWLFLTSNVTGVATAYQVKQATSDNKNGLNISDAVFMEMPSTNGDHNSVLAMQIVAAESVISSSQSNNVVFFKVFSQDLFGAIYDSLYVAEALGGTSMIPLPKKRTLQHKSMRCMADAVSEYDLNGFIAPDHEIEQLYGTEGIQLAHPSLTNPKTGSTATRDNDQSTIRDLHMTYTAVTPQLPPQVAEGKLALRDVLDTISETLQDMSTAQTLLQLSSETSTSQLRSTDIEDDSHTLEVWLENLATVERDSGQRHVISNVSEPEPLIELYHDLVDQWLSTLPITLSDRIRVQRERLIRQITFELYSSKFIIVPGQPTSADLPQELPLVVEPMGLSSQMQELAVETQPSSPTLPAVASSSQPAALPVHQLSPLMQYLDFKQPSPLLTKEQFAVDSLLAHLPLSPDFDPSAYSHGEVELNQVLARNEIINQGLDPKARRKAEKMSRARKKQLERQSQIKKVAFEQTTMLPSVMSSQLPIRAVQSSQGGPFMSSQPSLEDTPAISMTQPERGAHGTRDVKKAKVKGKSRQKGF